jgi:hypothetical protein
MDLVGAATIEFLRQVEAPARKELVNGLFEVAPPMRCQNRA